MKSHHPKNYTIIELINGREYLVKTTDYSKYSEYNKYYKLIVWSGSKGNQIEWKKQQGSLYINPEHILTVRSR